MSPRPQLGEFVQTDWSARHPSLAPPFLSLSPFTPLQFGAGASVGTAWRVWLALRDLLEPGAISFDSLIETSRFSPRSCHRGSVSKRGGVEVTRNSLPIEIPHTRSILYARDDSTGGPQRGGAGRGGPVSLSSLNETPSDVCVRWNQLNNACRNDPVIGLAPKLESKPLNGCEVFMLEESSGLQKLKSEKVLISQMKWEDASCHLF